MTRQLRLWVLVMPGEATWLDWLYLAVWAAWLVKHALDRIPYSVVY